MCGTVVLLSRKEERNSMALYVYFTVKFTRNITSITLFQLPFDSRHNMCSKLRIKCVNKETRYNAFPVQKSENFLQSFKCAIAFTVCVFGTSLKRWVHTRVHGNMRKVSLYSHTLKYARENKGKWKYSWQQAFESIPSVFDIHLLSGKEGNAVWSPLDKNPQFSSSDKMDMSCNLSMCTNILCLCNKEAFVHRCASQA